MRRPFPAAEIKAGADQNGAEKNKDLLNKLAAANENHT